MSRTSPLAPLRRIGDDVYFYEPVGPADADYQGPSLVVLSTWLGGASAKNIGRYVAGHRKLFRDAAVLLVTARLSEITVTPFARMHSRLQPARDILVRYILRDGSGGTSSSSPSILWHVFSGGGLNMAIQLARITRHELAAGGHAASPGDLDRAMGGVIMDCCPSDGSLSRTFKAAAYSLPNTLLSQTIGRLLLFPTIAVLLAMQNSGLLGRGGSLGDMQRAAHDPGVLGRSVRRMYLYSVSDKIVPWRFVNQHMAEAQDKGFDVEGEAIPGGGHCALLRGDANKYWRAVERFWSETEARRDPVVTGAGAGFSGSREGGEMGEMSPVIAMLRSRL
ncbi:hypothetical protein LMH87_006945 [Akanthomyces muscarius]|uniref:Uncharacterized protein n=1 Tax=Akanthomyces muscarius TaxID=2231603 RepID=A0A9W8UTI5_AKAMU|nr:hypothetical protein LMH87_006945 [Akanthomyces muscarius]KAJ4165308.1 hypothetical protein LMH87_006945 [Akanthomyces muscarius]